jgi:drug/metabolite transporter (DMT)-like permease
MVAGIILALLSALWFAAAGALQHSAARGIALERGAVANEWLPVLGLLRRMLVSRIWWFGLSLNVLGFLFHSAALHLSSITIVQALLSVQLMFALPFATAKTRTTPLARDWVGTAAVCLGIVTLVAARGPVPQTLERQGLVPLFAAVAAVVMGLLIVLARMVRGARTGLVGTAAGVGFSVTATFIIIVADQIVHSGPLGVVSHWQVYALALSGLAAAIIAQDAFASGSFPAALTAMTIADPIASWLWGAMLFDRVPPADPKAIGSLTLAAVLIGAGVALLAYSPTLAAARR